MRWIFSPEHGDLHQAAAGHPDALQRLGFAFVEAAWAGPQQRMDALAALTEALQRPDQRSAALRLVHWLRDSKAPRVRDAPLRVQRVPLETATLRQHLDLLIAPSVFEPEDWGFTFLEGLLRRPHAERSGERTAAEIGTGTGWISLALLLADATDHVVGYDINPVAIDIATANAIINSFDDHLAPRYDAQRRLLCERFQAAHSDLLQSAIDQEERFDLIVGCIPQVLAPSPDLDPQAALSAMDEDRLYDLSNYFVLQGVYEDHFGLGLLARALDQAVLALNPGGHVVLNIAGRPGAQVIDRMFARRGFEHRVVWSVRVQQAADTDIAVLASLEQRTGNPFEFYVNRTSRQPISASTALALQQASRPIWHDVRVIEASLRFERDLRPFLHTLNLLGGADLLDQLDLSRVDGEQISYLRALAARFAQARRAPYTHELGSPDLRAYVARYALRYFALPLEPDEIFIGPCRQEVLHGALRALTSPQDTVLLSASITPTYTNACRKAGVHTLLANDDLDEIIALTETLQPRLVALALTPDERRNNAALRRLIALTAAQRIPLILDESEPFTITSHQHRNDVLELLGREGRPPHVLVLIGLIANRVYPHLQPALLLGATGHLRHGLIAFAEATFSRNNVFAEHYYEHLFAELLSFQLRRDNAAALPDLPAPPEAPQLAPAMQATLAWPAFDDPPPYTGDAPLIRLDYGENELDIPSRLMKGVLLGFTNLGDDSALARTAEVIAGFTQTTLGGDFQPEEIVLGAGVFPLLYDAALALRHLLGRPPRVALPTGHYGYLPPIFTLAGCEVVVAQTRAEDAFLFTPQALDDLEALHGPIDLLFLNDPANPAGVRYPPRLLRDLLAWLQPRQTHLFLDAIFAHLDLLHTDEDRIQDATPALLTHYPGLRLRTTLFAGLSKAFAAGGLRLGWAATGSPHLRDLLLDLRTTEPTRHACLAAEVLLRGFRPGAPPEAAAEVLADLRATRRDLAAKRQRLHDLLTQAGLLLPKGHPAGLFLFPDATPLLGRTLRRDDAPPLTLTLDNLHHALRDAVGLQVNPGRWAGAPGHLRLCFSLTDPRFEAALRRLRTFFDRIEPAGA